MVAVSILLFPWTSIRVIFASSAAPGKDDASTKMNAQNPMAAIFFSTAWTTSPDVQVKIRVTISLTA
jgi:hypothetical protein